MSMTLGSRKGPDADINVTPLIDVLLVLLIIFMVILRHHNFGEEAEIPQPSVKDSVPRPDETVVLQLRDLGEGRLPALKINQEEIRWDKLEGRLRIIYAARAKKVAFFKADPNLDFEYVAEAIDVTHRAGVNRVGLLGGKD
jgi:biopolymer transport protein TolR